MDSQQPYFVDVILPLALPQLLTYFVPPIWNREVEIGKRVIVQLQNEKLYTAIIKKIHSNAPNHYHVKPIIDLLDEKPIITSTNLYFWQWISEYYMCTLGEVMTAALPSGLKLTSESKVFLRIQDENFEYEKLTDKELMLVEALEVRPFLTYDDVQNILSIKNIQPYLKRLIDKKIISVEQEVKEKYRPKFESYIQLTDDADNEDRLREILDVLVKSPKQLETLMLFINESNRYTNKIIQVKKSDFLKDVRVTNGAIKELVKKKVFVETKKKVGRFDYEVGEMKKIASYSDDQENALKEIKRFFESKNVVLVHGVTGSGKTEVYIQMITEAVEKKQQVLFLIPEIALTTQLISRIEFNFPGLVGVYHSKFNQNERVEIWNHVLNFNPTKESQQFQIILGARSSIFLPFQNLGLIIVDEEHDSSYKQYDPAPRYQARDTAIYLATLYKAKTILGSATPSLESFYNAIHQKYGYVQLNKRFGDVALPKIELVDLKKEMKSNTLTGSFTPKLILEMNESLEKKEQIILFQNRRGFSLIQQCNSCAHIPQCKNCDVSLTYHKVLDILKCHYCGYQEKKSEECIKCKSANISQKGFGTEKVEEEIMHLFPNARVGRLDFDTTRKKHSYAEIIQEFSEGVIDILVGTQMVTKGLDFDNVSLVGVLNADNLLHFPDYRSSERAYQLLTQVSGRAGRRKKQGKVVIQTYDVDHPTIQFFLNQNFNGLFQDEMADRQVYKYPPFVRMIELQVKNKEYHICKKVASELAVLLRHKMTNMVLGPEINSINRIRNFYLFNIYIKANRELKIADVKKYMKECISEIQKTADGRKSFISIDVDP